MAIVHCVFKSSSNAPSASSHAQYISSPASGRRRGRVELVQSGNLPGFAEGDPFKFWRAADAYERINGRTYTEIQFSLPRELNQIQRLLLARSAAKEFLGDRFAYTLAAQMLTAQDELEQPYMQMMFSERVVDSATRILPPDQFFKRNGARKDPKWNSRHKPREVRTRWCHLMNEALESAGLDCRVDPRSWADRGREDLVALCEDKLARHFGTETLQKRARVRELRHQRGSLPSPELDGEAAIRQLQQNMNAEITRIEQKCVAELEDLDASFVGEPC